MTHIYKQLKLVEFNVQSPFITHSFALFFYREHYTACFPVIMYTDITIIFFGGLGVAEMIETDKSCVIFVQSTLWPEVTLPGDSGS